MQVLYFMPYGAAWLIKTGFLPEYTDCLLNSSLYPTESGAASQAGPVGKMFSRSCPELVLNLYLHRPLQILKVKSEKRNEETCVSVICSL